eukprot:scaffold99889_cov29-Tisochrysis_lutea.AAC.4
MGGREQKGCSACLCGCPRSHGTEAVHIGKAVLLVELGDPAARARPRLRHTVSNALAGGVRALVAATTRYGGGAAPVATGTIIGTPRRMARSR